LRETFAYIFKVDEKAKQETSRNRPASVGFQLGLLFSPENVGDFFHRNVSLLSPDHIPL
jgi:hypothetical protein